MLIYIQINFLINLILERNKSKIFIILFHNFRAFDFAFLHVVLLAVLSHILFLKVKDQKNYEMLIEKIHNEYNYYIVLSVDITYM